MTGLSADHRRIADAVVEAFGELPRVVRYWDQPEEHSVDLAKIDDVPAKGFTSFSTLGLSDSPMLADGEEFGMRVELTGTCESRFDKFANVLSTAAFNIVKDQWFAYPGRIFPEVVAMYYRSSPMRHLLFTEPFALELEPLDLSDKTVAWLQAVPISEAELLYARQQAHAAGEDHALASLFNRTQPDLYDLDRPSVV